MSDRICPILLAGIFANIPNDRDARDNAFCLGNACAWWDTKYNLCLIEMIAYK